MTTQVLNTVIGSRNIIETNFGKNKQHINSKLSLTIAGNTTKYSIFDNKDGKWDVKRNGFKGFFSRMLGFKNTFSNDLRNCLNNYEISPTRCETNDAKEQLLYDCLTGRFENKVNENLLSYDVIRNFREFSNKREYLKPEYNRNNITLNDIKAEHDGDIFPKKLNNTEKTLIGNYLPHYIALKDRVNFDTELLSYNYYNADDSEAVKNLKKNTCYKFGERLKAESVKQFIKQVKELEKTVHKGGILAAVEILNNLSPVQACQLLVGLHPSERYYTLISRINYARMLFTHSHKSDAKNQIHNDVISMLRNQRSSNETAYTRKGMLDNDHKRKKVIKPTGTLGVVVSDSKNSA